MILFGKSRLESHCFTAQHVNDGNHLKDITKSLCSWWVTRAKAGLSSSTKLIWQRSST